MKRMEALIPVLRARSPLIAVRTDEPTRVADLLFLIAARPARYGFAAGAPPRPVLLWEPGQGLSRMERPFRLLIGESPPDLPGEIRLPPPRETQDLLAALENLRRLAPALEGQNIPGVWIFIWADRFLPNPLLEWVFQEVYEALRTTRHKLVLLAAPGASFPDSILPILHVVDFPRPDREELEAVIRDILAAAPASPLARMAPAEVARALAGLTIDQAERVLSLVQVRLSRDSDQDPLPLLLREKARLIRQIPALEWVEGEDLAHVGGLGRLKDLARRLRAALSPEAEQFGIRLPRGIMLAGFPGTGKSLFARALGWALGLPVIRLDLGALFGPYVGQSEATTRLALQVAEAAAPVILWIDELEKGMAGFSGSAGGLDSGTTARVVATILTWMQEATAPVVVVATVNRVEALLPELVERFALRFFVDLPGPRARQEILRIHLRKRGCELPEEVLGPIARAARGHSGRSLEQAVEQALLEAFEALRAAGGPVAREALARILPGILERWIRQIPPLSEAAPESLARIADLRARFLPAADPDPEDGHAGPVPGEQWE